MTDVDSRETAWAAVHEALPAGWRVGPPTFDPGRRVWSVTAWSGTRGGGRPPVTVPGTGDDEMAALRDLDDRLRGVPHPDGSCLDELRRRARLAYVAGAESTWRELTGRPMTAPSSSASLIGRQSKSGLVVPQRWHSPSSHCDAARPRLGWQPKLPAGRA
jgi:hypothetical protein